MQVMGHQSSGSPWTRLSAPARGEIWIARLDPVVGHEQAGTRPALVVSSNVLNQGPAGLVVVLAISTTYRGVPLHIQVNPPEGGLREQSYVMCDAVRSISVLRLVDRWGMVSAQTMAQVEDRLKILFTL